MSAGRAGRRSVPGGAQASPPSGNLVVAGVGGQGVILASNLIAQVLLDAGYDVKKSEVHGMSQRGGTVVSHVRFGPEVHSVMLEPGSADWIVAFEWEEGLRALSYLKPGGVALVSTERRIPPAAMLDHREPTLDYAGLGEVPPGVVAVDTFAVAGDAAAAAPVVAQTVLIGALSRLLPFSSEMWEQAIALWVPQKALATNLTAFERGRALSNDAVADGEADAAATGPDDASAPGAAPGGRAVRRAAPAPDGAQAGLVPTLRIERSWCKGCEICVAVCPERCLVLDNFDVAVLAYPQRCTGCQLCAWLCPDLAIDVGLVPAAAIAGHRS